MARFFQKEDLELACGGAKILVELLDKDGDGIADQPLVDRCIDSACIYLAGIIEPTVMISGLSAPFPLGLVLQGSNAGVFYAWALGSDNQVVPDTAQKLYDAATNWAQLVRDRKAGLGDSPAPALAPPAEMIDNDPRGEGRTLAGFKRGLL